MSYTKKVEKAVGVALAATKAALKAALRMGHVTATTPGIRFKKDGTAVITVKLEMKGKP